MDTIIVIVCVIVSLVSGFAVLSMWQDQTSQKGGVSPNVDMGLVSAARMAYSLARGCQTPELSRAQLALSNL